MLRWVTLRKPGPPDTGVIDWYLLLSDTEQQEFQEIIQRQELRETRQMMTTYEERGLLRGKKDAALRIARVRFGADAERLAARIQAVETEADVDALIDHLLAAASLEELGAAGE